MKLQTENRAFSSDQMIACGKCGKSNPPTRASCLYCAAAIELPEERRAEVKLNLRKLENWENGFNIVLVSPSGNADAACGAARYLKSDDGVFGRMLSAKSPFPLARLESETDARIAAERLSAFGLSTKIVRDVDLKIGKPNTRLRSVEFLNDGIRFTAFNTQEQRTVTSGEIILIVVGRIIESETESVEKGRKQKRWVLAESTTSTDDLLIDIYTSGADKGWRVSTKGFDFSPLGYEKSLLAIENIQRLLEKLRAFAPTAKVIDEYSDLIEPLSEVWDIERRTDFGGMKRTGVLRSGFATVARTSNLEQFSKYSRLQRILLLVN